MSQSRAIPGPVRDGLEAEAGPDALVAFLTLTHPNLAAPLRLVSDVVDYERGGLSWTGVLFGWRPLNDTEGVPASELVLPNVDRVVSRALDRVRQRAGVTLELCSTRDFSPSGNPRTELTSAAVVYGFTGWELVGLDWDVSEARGRVILRDYAQEPFPGRSATEALLPGLFR